MRKIFEKNFKINKINYFLNLTEENFDYYIHITTQGELLDNDKMNIHHIKTNLINNKNQAIILFNKFESIFALLKYLFNENNYDYHQTIKDVLTMIVESIKINETR